MIAPANPFAAAFAIVVGDEGGYSTDASDPGNWTGGAVGSGTLNGTNWGISAAAYPDLDIANLTLADAQALYQARYWPQAASLPWPVSLVVFDGEVNSGGEGARALQEVLGVKVDGDVGPKTLRAIGGWEPVELACRTSAKRAEWYAGLGQPQFVDGWEKRLFVNLWKGATAT